MSGPGRILVATTVLLASTIPATAEPIDPPIILETKQGPTTDETPTAPPADAPRRGIRPPWRDPQIPELRRHIPGRPERRYTAQVDGT